ncbi:MAG: TonB C-terminal domain-containing protein, partial [Opitutaceae bacterium]|nr:TonB C-terminal domain-containing protein [Opitutaceae bacterium]
YWERFHAKLRDAHEKPAGLDDGLVVRVEFVLRVDGTLGDVRVLSSSGDAAFDASVVAAFRRVRGLGVPPAGKVGVNEVTFRTRAE